jgi:hypothetical protein
MHLSARDGLATLFVAAAVVIYALWATGAALSGWSAREAAGAVFALGFATCLTDQKQMAMIYGPGRWPPGGYAVLVSVLGAAAMAAGIIALVTGSTAMVAALMAAVACLWAAATARHALARGHGRPAGPPPAAA